uniref:Subfamily a member 2-like partial n=1 Tax=Hirondellea gigas TaxID=1518452 RepID=A0A2P2I9S1_9CRUS
MFNFGGGFGGFGGHDHGHPQREKEVDTNKYYDVLGISKTASGPEIKKAFHKLARKHHPDKGGDEDKFKEMRTAYETLSIPEKREVYDRFGEEGGPGASSMSDIFDLFTGQGRQGRGGGKARRRRGEDVVFPLKVALEDLYNGMTKKLRLTKNVLCSTCDGQGSKSGKSTKCRGCNGSGLRVVVRQLGPGMIQQMQTTCPDCDGEGSCVSDADRCPKCKGGKVVKEKKTLEVYIDKGMRHGQKIPFQGEADQSPGTDPGDVIVILQQKDHPVFGREGLNLFIQKKVSLVEALCGVSFTVTHLDGRVLRVVTGENGEILTPGEVKCIENEGMPQHKNPYVRGGLFIEFQVEFPPSGTLSNAQKKKLRSLLPPPINMEVGADADCEECVLSTVSLEEIRERQRAYRAQAEVYDEDDDDEHHGHGCRQQ